MKYLIFLLATIVAFAQDCSDKELNASISRYNNTQTAENIAIVNYQMLKYNDCKMAARFEEVKTLLKSLENTINSSSHTCNETSVSSSPRSTKDATDMSVTDSYSFGTGY